MRRVLKKNLSLTALLLSVATVSTFASNPALDEPTSLLKRTSASAVENSPKRQKVLHSDPINLVIVPFDKNGDLFAQLNPSTIQTILSYLDCETDRKELLALSGMSRNLHQLVENKYKAYVEEKHYAPWMGMPLSHKALYITNSRLIKMMGMYDNWRILYPAEKQYFYELGARFATTQFLPENSVVKPYVEFLVLKKPSPESELIITESQRNIDFGMLSRRFNNVVASKKLTNENNMALYFHYLYVLSKSRQEIASVKNVAPWADSENPMLSVTKDTLIALREGMAVPINQPDANPLRHPEWTRLLQMEPFPTLKQYQLAAIQGNQLVLEADRSPQKRVLNWNLKYMEGKKSLQMPIGEDDYNWLATNYYKAGNAVDAAKNFELRMLEIQRNGGQIQATDYGNLAHSYLASRNFVEAAKNYELYISEVQRNGGQIQASDYVNLARSYYASRNFVEAAKNYEIYISEIQRNGGEIQASDYGNLSRSYYASRNFVEAAKNYELYISEVQRNGGQIQAIDYRNLAEVYFCSQQYVDAAKNYELYISEVQRNGGLPEISIYNNLANTFFFLGNYVSAESIFMEHVIPKMHTLNAEYQYKIYNTLSLIYIKLVRMEEATHYKNLRDQLKPQ